ncbi:TPA: hypothetical protein MYL90_002504 [Klebsiella pneumoniae]|nr:hypothetical protein [Klebsiella pneumoniae]
MITNFFTLKTSTDSLCYLCQLESELLQAKAFQRLGLLQERDDPRELTPLEDLIVGTGTAYGFFVYLLRRGDVPPLCKAGHEVLDELQRIGNQVLPEFWCQAIENGKHDARADLAMAAQESAYFH